MRVPSCSFSSDKKLSRCEQQYSYRYDEQLRPKLKKSGLLRGDWLHRLYEAYYRSMLSGKSAQEALEAWKKAHQKTKKLLWDKIFDEEKEMYGEDFPDVIESLAEHYFDHWMGWHEQWEIIAVEEAHSVDTKFGFPIRWKTDLIVKDKEDGKVWLVETKNKKKIPGVDERILQPQGHAYCFLTQKKTGLKIGGIIWNYIRTSPVPRPKINKNGTLSKRKINTDQRSMLLSLQEADIKLEGGMEEIFNELPPTLALERIPLSVNFEIGEKWVRQWVERARRAQAIKKPLRSWLHDCKTHCDYYLLCQAELRGDVDSELIKISDFTTKDDRPEETNE